jgi:4-hydroxybenzoate polyprenyltransferase
LLAYLIFYPIYINDRLRGIKIDELTNSERTKHLKSYLRTIPKIIVFSVLLLLALLFYIGNVKFSIFALLLLFFGMLYPFYFKNITKKIIAFKNFYVALFFTAIALAPVIYYSYSLNLQSAISLTILMLFVFLKTVLMQILLDCKDIEGDKPFGLLTLPVLIGKEKTVFFLKIASALVTILVLITAVFFVRAFPAQMLILLFVIPFNFYSYNLAQKQNYYGYIIGSGEFLLWFILILIVKTMG